MLSDCRVEHKELAGSGACHKNKKGGGKNFKYFKKDNHERMLWSVGQFVKKTCRGVRFIVSGRIVLYLSSA